MIGIPSNGQSFSGFFGGNALTRYSGTYIDIRQVVQDLQDIAAWMDGAAGSVSLALSALPNSINGLLPGTPYWDGDVLSRAPVDPSTYPTTSAGLQSGSIYFSGGVYHAV